MDIDAMLEALNAREVDYILIGGVNYLLRHEPELTFDVDIWVNDTNENLQRLNQALQDLEAAWGPTEREWKPVPNDFSWLRRQSVFCLTTRAGALDIFRDVKGLEGQYGRCKMAAFSAATGTSVPYHGLSDEDMLRCQEALPPNEQKQRRMAKLREELRK